MLVYNDIEKLNEFKKHPVRISRRVINSKHALSIKKDDLNNDLLFSQKSDSNYSGDGKQSLKDLYKQNSFAEETSSGVGTNKML